MKRCIIFKKKGIKACIVFLYFLLFVIGCANEGDQNHSSATNETATVSFAIALHDEPLFKSLGKGLARVGTTTSPMSIQPASVDCGQVAEIVCEVYDDANNDLTSASFECSAHQGTMDVPVGSNREFVVLGMGVEGDILYHGRIFGDIVSGQTNDLGTIDLYAFYVSELLAPDDGAIVAMEGLSLTWVLCETADNYRVWISSDDSFDTLIVDDFATGGSYVPSGLSLSTTYYWKVFACDNHQHQGPASQEIQRFTTFSGTSGMLWYKDADSDGYGDPNAFQRSTIQPDGYVSNNLDCNDMDSAVYPNADEICGDGIDQDCNGDDLLCLDCAEISGSWCGAYSEIDCFGDSVSGSWEGEVGVDCSIIAYSDWGEFISGKIDPGSLLLEADSLNSDCGYSIITGQWGQDFASGSYTYSLGGNGTFTGERCE